MKKFLNLFVVSVLMICISGCGKVKPITADNFKQEMAKKNYNVVDVTKQFESAKYVKKAYVALEGNKKYQIEFYQIDNKENTLSFYNTNRNIFKQKKSNKSSETNVDLENHSKYTLSSDGKYMVVSRIDNTVVYLNVDSKHKKEVKNILDELGY